MPFPEFRPDSYKVLFFSRGRGRGHAVLDLEVMNEIQREMPELDLRFVSYAEGAEAISSAGRPIINLGLSSQNSYIETSVLAGRLIGWLQPDLVIAHEEFAAIPAAKIFDKATLFLTDWFTTPERLTMAALRMADHILFLEEPGVFDEPESLAGKVTYCGPYFREFHYTRADRLKAREECGLPAQAKVLGVFPGSWRESTTPMAELLEASVGLLQTPDVYVLWVAGDDANLLSDHFAMKPRFLIREFEDQIDAWMVACDLAITKCNRKSAMELYRLGIPSIALSWGYNPIDDGWVKRHKEIEWLSAANLSPRELATRLDRYFADGMPPEPPPPERDPLLAKRQFLDHLASRIRKARRRIAAGA